MVLFDYFEDLMEDFEYIIALSSLVGLARLIVGIILAIRSGSRLRHKMLGVVVVSIILLAVCGVDTGFKYFRIFLRYLDLLKERFYLF
jgi:VIT1/CCC1 family predicted Fe2+/Mn2+ transporter